MHPKAQPIYAPHMTQRYIIWVLLLNNKLHFINDKPKYDTKTSRLHIEAIIKQVLQHLQVSETEIRNKINSLATDKAPAIYIEEVIGFYEKDRKEIRHLVSLNYSHPYVIREIEGELYQFKTEQGIPKIYLDEVQFLEREIYILQQISSLLGIDNQKEWQKSAFNLYHTIQNNKKKQLTKVIQETSDNIQKIMEEKRVRIDYIKNLKPVL